MSEFQERLSRVAQAQKLAGLVCPDDYRMVDGKYVHVPSEQGAIWKVAYETLHDLIVSSRPTKVVLLIGIPGSGKSTWLSQNAQEGVVYFDATMTGRKDRKRFLEAVRASSKVVGYNVPVEAVWLDTAFGICSSRNAARPVDRRVPDHVIESMASRLAETPPEAREGFSQVIRVKTRD
jgi:predicted kinase